MGRGSGGRGNVNIRKDGTPKQSNTSTRAERRAAIRQQILRDQANRGG